MIIVEPNSERSATVGRILQSVASNHGRASEGLVRGFTSRWLEVFPGSRFTHEQFANDGRWWQARTAMPGVMLRGFTDFVLAVASASPSPELLSDIAGRTALIVLPSRLDEASCRDHPGSRHWVLVTADDMAKLFTGDSLEKLLTLIRTQISPLALIPFQTTRPVIGPMFRGRRRELDRLLEDDETCFALTAPSRDGKTSIARQFIHELITSRDPRAERVYFINLQELPSRGPDAVARFLAMKIDPSPRADRMTLGALPSFFKRMASLKGGALQLVLDEADEICGDLVFNLLCDLCREDCPSVRPTWIGRGRLLHDLASAGASGAQRVLPLRPAPLTEDEAWQLFAEPLRQWGASFEDSETLRREVFRRSSGLPHLIQELGRGICDAIRDGAPSTIRPEHLADATNRFAGLSRLMGHVNDLCGPLEKAAAYVVLIRDGVHAATPWTASRLSSALNAFGIKASTERAVDILVELTLHNFLIWKDGEILPGRWDFRRIATANTETILRLIKELPLEERTP